MRLHEAPTLGILTLREVRNVVAYLSSLKPCKGNAVKMDENLGIRKSVRFLLAPRWGAGIRSLRSDYPGVLGRYAPFTPGYYPLCLRHDFTEMWAYR